MRYAAMASRVTWRSTVAGGDADVVELEVGEEWSGMALATSGIANEKLQASLG